ncbi:bacillithiol system redox-active protein YtxJ [Cohnella nanjingensis]|uniref:Bacillithiol system redox-active protein YtxJ n=1 Tax=Cohnella nanjingensis TaxID=1387779 RepID=A0A7X0RPB1_9BACL|nr:bacillithiol system redox-active protein YtxJ [Cohnella nanjingensis]MBB6671120.1 bacillithiol system redox-active protein YtxJ [Cohnella nanjingensis]
MAEAKRLTTLEQWEEALNGSAARPLLLFKHSTQCPISAGAHEELQHYMADATAAPMDFAIVHVIEERPVSNAIAETLGVQHKSPQAILVQDGKPQWDESHWRITYDFLSEKLGAPQTAGDIS